MASKHTNTFLNALLFSIILITGICLRFYNLDWGAPYYFHPDERNVASAVTRLEFPEQLNPDFFAYGSLPIYTIYGLGVFANLIESSLSTEPTPILSVSFERAIFYSRLISALFSVVIIYLIMKLLMPLGRGYATLGGFITAGNVGLIQYAHFGTFEIWLTLLFLLLFISLIHYLKNESLTALVWIGILIGALTAVKISSLVIVLPVGMVLITPIIRHLRKRTISQSTAIRKLIFSFALVSLLGGLVTLLSFPYLLLDTESFLASMNYESSVALGTLPVFYTGGFTNTLPILYQITHVFPYLLNPLNALLIAPALIVLALGIKKHRQTVVILTVVFFATIFLSQAFLYVKWIRYYVPTVPFAVLILVFGMHASIRYVRNVRMKTILFTVISLVLIAVSTVYAYAYLRSTLMPDFPTVTAANFAEKNIPHDARIISEIYDLGIVPFNARFTTITLFDFYVLDDEWTRESKREELQSLLSSSDYLILPSQRILRNRTLFPERFPEGHKFYNQLSTDQFRLIYRTPCDIFCKLLYMGNPLYGVEETANVFDRPTVYIYEILNDH